MKQPLQVASQESLSPLTRVSNEAGIGTEAMIHGAAKTSHPVKQGLVAMTDQSSIH